jgi:CubicO group peptidase (beta-lactamase class C family)
MQTTRRRFVTGLSATLCPFAAANSRLAPSHTAFDSASQRIGNAVATGQVTGVAVAVTHKGSIVWEEGFGWADEAAQRAVTSRTPFCLASITKPFTTTLLAMLAADGRIGLDQAAGQYFDGLAPRGPNGDPRGATIRRLGAHAGGLSTIFEMYFPDQGMSSPTTETILQQYGGLAFPPGETYEYSNVGYAMLGGIASKVTDQEFGKLMRARVLEPLEMHDSFFGTDRKLPSRALQYEAAGKALPYYTTATPASGELFVSAHDLARFALFNLAGIRGQGSTLLDGRWLTELHRPVLAGPAGTATSFGWFRARTPAGLNVIYKDGGQPGVSTTMYLVPSHDVSCLVLTNRSDNHDLAIGIVNEIMASFINGWETPDATPDSQLTSFIARPEDRGRWEGQLIGGGARMQAVLEFAADNQVTLALDGDPPAPLTAIRSQAGGVVGKTTGTITAPDAVRAKANRLAIKLIPYAGKLVGRVLASAARPGTVLPYVISLSHARS